MYEASLDHWFLRFRCAEGLQSLEIDGGSGDRAGDGATEPPVEGFKGESKEELDEEGGEEEGVGLEVDIDIDIVERRRGLGFKGKNQKPTVPNF